MPSTPWTDESGVIVFADGRKVRGRGLSDPLPAGLKPEFGLYLTAKPPMPMSWETRWLRWPDFWLPRDPDEATAAINDVFDRAPHQRVEVACSGGTGRTGTALACLAVIAGTGSDEAVAFVRDRYRPGAVETPWQRRYVRRFLV